MAHTRRNIILGLFGAVLVGGLVYVSFRTEPIAVDTHTVTRGTLIATVDVDGVTRVADLYEIAAPITGVAQRSPVAVGDPVVAGETVVALVEPVSPALLDTRTRLQAEAAVREAEAALNVAETARAQAVEAQSYAQTQYSRTQTLVERGTAAISRLEDSHQALAVADAAVASADARILQAQGALDRAQAALVETSDTGGACCEPILSPANGVVLEVDTVSERPVAAGARLLSVGDPAALEIVADLLSADAVRLPPAARATVERWGGAPLEARMVRIEPTARTQISALGIEEQRVDVVFEFTSPPEERTRLGHGFSVFLSVVEIEVEDALLVPLNATFRQGEGWAVFRVTGDRAELVPVTLGQRNARFVTVVSGLEEGAQVVEHPNESLSDGALIVLRATF